MSCPCHSASRVQPWSRSSFSAVTFGHCLSKPLNWGQNGGWINESICGVTAGLSSLAPTFGLMLITVTRETRVVLVVVYSVHCKFAHTEIALLQSSPFSFYYWLWWCKDNEVLINFFSLNPSMGLILVRPMTQNKYQPRHFLVAVNKALGELGMWRFSMLM